MSPATSFRAPDSPECLYLVNQAEGKAGRHHEIDTALPARAPSTILSDFLLPVASVLACGSKRMWGQTLLFSFGQSSWRPFRNFLSIQQWYSHRKILTLQRGAAPVIHIFFQEAQHQPQKIVLHVGGQRALTETLSRAQIPLLAAPYGPCGHCLACSQTQRRISRVCEEGGHIPRLVL